MKKFIKLSVVFLIPILILVTVLEIGLRQIPNDYRCKNAQLQLEKERVKTLILGSSHSMYGFNPEYFSAKAYNLGHVSQTIDLDYYLLQKYIEELPQLKTVLLRLSYTTLHEQIGTGSESWRLKDYNLYYGLNVSSKLKYKSEVLSVKLDNNLSRIKDYYIDNAQMITVDNSGWASFDKPHAKKDIASLGAVAAKKHTIETNDLVIENLRFLEDFVALCDKKGIAIILVNLPAHKSYIEHLDKNQLDLVLSAGKQMDRSYNNCEYLNLLEDKEFTDEDFYDGDHLNTKGAKKLSLHINSLIEN